MSLLRKCLAVLALGALVGSARADVTVLWTGPDAFDSWSMMFGPFLSDGLNSITSGLMGGGLYHDHGINPTTHSMDIHLNGAWVNVWNHTTFGDNVDYALSGIAPLVWACGWVDGILLYSTPVGAAYHNIWGVGWGPHNAIRFNFNQCQQHTIPEPSTVVLLGLGALGMVIARRRWSA